MIRVRYLFLLNQIVFNLIEQKLQVQIISQNRITSNVVLFKTIDEEYILKSVNSKCKEVYDFLKSQEVANVNYPVLTLNTKEGLYYIYKSLTKYKYPIYKQIGDFLESLDILHKSTAYEKKLSKKSFKYLYRTYKKLDYKFQLLEMYIRESEVKVDKTDYDWVVLSKYQVFLNVKPMMYDLQKKIHKYVDEEKPVIFSLNHGNPSLDHIINKQLYSFDNAYLGIFISDFAKAYVTLDHINVDWFTLIDELINPYGSNFYKIYFKFLVLYIYIISLDFDLTNSNNACNKYIQIARKIAVFTKNFDSYQ